MALIQSAVDGRMPVAEVSTEALLAALAPGKGHTEEALAEIAQSTYSAGHPYEGLHSVEQYGYYQVVGSNSYYSYVSFIILNTDRPNRYFSRIYM